MSRQHNEPLNTPIVQAFGLKRMPFPQELLTRDLFELRTVANVASMVEFSVNCSMFFALIGEVGCGKTSALRYACDKIPDATTRKISIVAGIWNFTEMLRQLLSELHIEFKPYQPSVMIRLIQEQLLTTQQEGRKALLVIDEAHLLKPDAYAQLHILAQHANAKGPLLSLVLCGQEELSDKLNAPSARPLASRISEGYYIPSLVQDDFELYIEHHLKLAGAPHDLFSDLAKGTIWQASNGNLRSIGRTCLAALQLAANRQLPQVTPDCVREVTKGWWADSIKPHPLE